MARGTVQDDEALRSRLMPRLKQTNVRTYAQTCTDTQTQTNQSPPMETLGTGQPGRTFAVVPKSCRTLCTQGCKNRHRFLQTAQISQNCCHSQNQRPGQIEILELRTYVLYGREAEATQVRPHGLPTYVHTYVRTRALTTTLCETHMTECIGALTSQVAAVSCGSQRPSASETTA